MLTEKTIAQTMMLPCPKGCPPELWVTFTPLQQSELWQWYQSYTGTPNQPTGVADSYGPNGKQWSKLTLWEKKVYAGLSEVSVGTPPPPKKGIFPAMIPEADVYTVAATATPPPPPTKPTKPNLDPPEQIPPEAEYWLGLIVALSLATAQVTEQIVVTGARAANSIGLGIDFDGIHREALAITKTTSPAWMGMIADTTRKQLFESLIKWQTEGLGKRGLPDLIADLEPLFGEKRARRIAVTEATRLFAAGNQLAAEQSDLVGGLQWHTAADEMVCPTCGPRHLKIFPKGSPPPCPAHVNCRCSLLPAIWDYIRRNPRRWQGGPIPPA